MLTRDTQAFVIIGAIPWFIVLPFCSGVFLIMARRSNVTANIRATERTSLLAHSQGTNIHPPIELSTVVNADQALINPPLESTVEPFEEPAIMTDGREPFCGMRWGFSVGMVVVSLAYAVNSGADYYTSYIEFANETRMTYGWHRARTACHFGSYTINPLLLIPVLVSVLQTYRNIAIKSDKLRKVFTENHQNIESVITEIIERAEEEFLPHKRSSERIELRNANIFVSIYLVCCLIWSLGTVYYVVKTKSTILAEVGLFIKCFAHLVSYATLVFFMWRTNGTIDATKETIKWRLDVNSLQKKGSTIDMFSFHNVINYCDSYAKIFKMKPSVPGIIITVISTGAPVLVSLIKNEILPWKTD